LIYCNQADPIVNLVLPFLKNKVDNLTGGALSSVPNFRTNWPEELVDRLVRLLVMKKFRQEKSVRPTKKCGEKHVANYGSTIYWRF